MAATEVLCDLMIVKAQYDARKTNEGDMAHFFEIQIVSEHKQVHFDIPARSGELFAAELDVLASIIRARVTKARLTGEEST